MMMKRYLNIGCGPTFHEAWDNIDIISCSRHVRQHDILKGLPYSDETFDAVYHSHIIEHLTCEEAVLFLNEAMRVLKKNGIMRVVTPDLETIARLYLQKLQSALNGIAGASDDYEWILLELFDQTVRDHPGGRMACYLNQHRNKEFVFSRIGHEAFAHWYPVEKKSGCINKIRKTKLNQIVKRLKEKIVCAVVGVIAGGKAKRACENGFFRNSGEIHKFLYDRYSLAKLLTTAGLSDVSICQANESRIPEFNCYQLDVVNDNIRKPDSIFMEGIKP